MKNIDQLEDMKKVVEPKDWSAGNTPMNLNSREKKEESKK
jgi:hypothetical protein